MDLIWVVFGSALVIFAVKVLAFFAKALVSPITCKYSLIVRN
jgi:hypothetical protein